MAEQGSVTLPRTTVEWTLRNPRRKDERTYEQTELSIEGEARLLSLARQIGLELLEQNIDWDRIIAQFDDGAEIEWAFVLDVLGLIAEKAPDLVVDSTLVFLGIFPTTDTGERNAAYDDERAFLRGAIKFATWTDMVRAFIEQNDYQRIAGPFSSALGLTAPAQGGTTSQQPSPLPSAQVTEAATPDGSSDTSAGAPSGST